MYIQMEAYFLFLAIITAAMDMMGGDGIDKQCRTPEIMADAAYVMLTRDSRSFTGNFVIGMVQNKIENCHHTIIYNDEKNL